MASSFKGAHFPKDSSLMGVRWYVAYPLSSRQVEELMEERGVPVDHATIQRWVMQYSPLLEEAFHRRKRLVWVSWRLDETYMRVKGEWRYRYRAVDKYGETIGCVPPFTRGTLGHEIGLALGRALRRLARITPDRYALRSFSIGKSVGIKGSGWRLPCRCSLSRLSRRCTRTHWLARPSKTARR